MATKPPEQTPSDDGSHQDPSAPDQPGTPADASEASAGDGSLSVAELATVLRAVVPVGVDHATPTHLRALFDLSCVRDRARDDSDDALTAAAQDVIHDGLAALGDGRYGQAARLVFGATDDTRGMTRQERRRLAAYQIDVLPQWFARRYLPEIAKDIAAQVLKIEHATTRDDSDGTAASDDAGTAVVRIVDAAGADTAGTAATEADGRRPRWRRLLRIRPRTDDGTAPVALASGPATLAPGAQQRQLTRVLTALGDEQLRQHWRVAFVVLGAFVFLRWGLDAVPRYVLVVAVLAVAKNAAEMVREWRASRSLAFGDRWPRLIVGMLVMLFAAGLVTQQDDGEPTAGGRADCSLGLAPDCDGSGLPDTTADPHPSPYYTPTTYADPPARASAAECPPAGNTQRRLSFDDVPPLCIDPDNRYTATIRTNYGHFTMALNTQNAMYTVNNFVYLARWHFYDGVQLLPSPQPTEPTVLPTEIWTHLLSLLPVAPTPEPDVSDDPATSDTTTDDNSDSDRTTTTDDDRATTTTSDPDAGAGVPGYSLVFETHDGDYPDDETLYAVMVDTGRPDQFAIIVSPQGHDDVAAADGTYPVLGAIDPECREVFAQRDAGQGWDVRPSDETIVIESIDITEEPATTPTTTPVPNNDPCGQLAAAQDDEGQQQP